jgi:hypothetical protein
MLIASGNGHGFSPRISSRSTDDLPTPEGPDTITNRPLSRGRDPSTAVEASVGSPWLRVAGLSTAMLD